MDFSGLYELIERFHRTNQLPAFLIGVLVSVFVGILGLRFLRLRIVGSGVNSVLGRMERQNAKLVSEKDLLRNQLQHAQKDADADRLRIGELTGRLEAHAEKSMELASECERLKEAMVRIEHERQQLTERNRKTRRLVVKLRTKLAGVEISDGRIWEVRRR